MCVLGDYTRQASGTQYLSTDFLCTLTIPSVAITLRGSCNKVWCQLSQLQCRFCQLPLLLSLIWLFFGLLRHDHSRLQPVVLQPGQKTHTNTHTHFLQHEPKIIYACSILCVHLTRGTDHSKFCSNCLSYVSVAKHWPTQNNTYPTPLLMCVLPVS